VRATLFYNPAAGKRHTTRTREVGEICALLDAHGYQAEAVATLAAGSAKMQVREAVANGAETIFACGGDGTVHDVLQGILESGDSAASRPILGIVPFGSANALARHLKLSMSPVEAARQQLAFLPRTIPVGRAECNGSIRYFTVMAGAGPDGMLVYKMLITNKRRLGRMAYYIRAAKLFATRRTAPFQLEFVESGSEKRHSMRAVSAMAVRIDDLGGLFSKLTRAGQVHHPHLQLIAVRPPGPLSLPMWFVAGWLGLNHRNPLLHAVNVDEFTCTTIGASRIHVQADGEWLGTAPMRVTLLQDAVRLLIPDSPP